MLDFEARGKPSTHRKLLCAQQANPKPRPTYYAGSGTWTRGLHWCETSVLNTTPALHPLVITVACHAKWTAKNWFFFSIWCLAPANCVWRIGGGASPHVIMLTIYSNKTNKWLSHVSVSPKCLWKWLTALPALSSSPSLQILSLHGWWEALQIRWID